MESTRDRDVEIEKKEKEEETNKQTNTDIVFFSSRFNHLETLNLTSGWVRNRLLFGPGTSHADV